MNCPDKTKTRNGQLTAVVKTLTRRSWSFLGSDLKGPMYDAYIPPTITATPWNVLDTANTINVRNNYKHVKKIISYHNQCISYSCADDSLLRFRVEH